MTPPVIAVFGSSIRDTLGPAVRIGQQIAQHGGITLTGASNPPPLDPEPETVKDAAATGAIHAYLPHNQTRWIGVDRTVERRAPRQGHDRSWMVLQPGYQHKRNLLEAYLCDVAIALPGKAGTKSEVAFCLALHRPVLLLGDHSWAGLNPPTPPALLTLAKTTLAKMVEQEVESPFDSEIVRLVRQLVHLKPTVLHLPLPATQAEAASVVQAALALVKDPRVDDAFPGWLKDADTAHTYLRWLDGVREGVPSGCRIGPPLRRTDPRPAKTQKGVP